MSARFQSLMSFASGCNIGPTQRPGVPLAAIADLIGSVDGLPTDLSARKKHYLKAAGYGRKRAP